MKISYRNIPKFLGGGTTFNLDNWINLNKNYYDWYSKIYPNALKLAGNPLQQRNDNWDKEQLSSSHYTTDDLRRSAYNNYLYTGDYNARQSDLLHWANSLLDLNNISDLDLVSRYNTIAGRIRAAREAPQTYNTRGYTGTNRDFRSLFESRSKRGTNNPLYVIGYLDNLEDIEGTSTWLRRMDRYQTEFEDDTEEGKKNRVFYIKRPNGTTVKVYKKANGDIGLFSTSKINPDSNSENAIVSAPPEFDTTVQAPERKPLYTFKKPEIPNIRKFQAKELPEDSKNKFKEAFLNLLNNPNLYATGRLIGTLINNNRVYDEALKAIKPNLISPYRTARQVVGDEATKLAYYRRAAEGVTKASLPMTSDADRQVAYQMEAQRAANELRALGDLADNLEIRRTSDESNLHLWANIQRENQAANANLASILDANARRHNLLALKHSAQWSSIDNYLQGIEYRRRLQLAEQLALNDQIFALEQSNAKYDDPEYMEAYENLLKVLNEHKNPSGYGYDEANPDVRDARQNLARALTNLKIKQLIELQIYNKTRHPIFAKQGTKVTWKKKDDLLYKSAKDVVEHFRKMTKLAYDSISKRPKETKLVSHPKTKKYQLGGVAPFTVYTPVALGGETTTSTSSSTTSSKGNTKDDTLDLLKNLFKEVSGKGLPIDVNTIYLSFQSLLNNYSLFGAELSTEDIASMYLQAMQQLNSVLHSKEIYDKAKAYATLNDALNEFAVTVDGQYVILDTETGKISFTKNLSDMPKNKTPLTNQHLLYLREYSPLLLLGLGDYIIENVVNNGMGINKIGSAIKALAGNIGSSTSKIEGLSEVESKKVKAGVQLLAQTDGTPDGIYKITNESKDSKALVQAALEYILGMLSPSLISILNAHGGAKPLILSFLSSLTGITVNQSILPLTGKATKENLDSSLDKVTSNPLIALLREIGGTPIRYNIVTRDSNTRISVNGTSYSSLPKVEGDMSINEMLNKSKINGIVLNNKYGITFGDLLIDPSNLKDIMYSDVGGVIVTLPCKIVNGVKQVNLDIKEAYERAELKALQVSLDRSSKEFLEALGKGLQEEHLDSLLDSNGYPNKNMFAQFLVVEGYTTDRIPLKKDSQYIEKVKNPTSELETRMNQALSTDSKKSNYSIDIDDHWGFFEGGWDDIYRGTVFIPLTNNTNAAINSWGSNSNINLSTELEELFQISTKSANFNNNNSFE